MKKGISLVALVITIIVLIILTSAVVLTMMNESILDKADEAKNKQNEQEVYSLVQREVLNLQAEDYRLKVGQGFEEALENKLKKKYPEANTEVTLSGEKVIIKYTLNNETYRLLLDKEYKLTLTENVDTVPTTESYIGYYADVDGDKVPDGVIYADLGVGGSGTWNNHSEGIYEYPKITEGLKEYYICSESYTGFGDKWTKPVLTAVEGSGEKDRFYVMALEDVNIGTQYCWYDAAFTKLDNIVSNTTNDFGEGRNNTNRMIEKWNNSEYGTQNNDSTYLDMWGVIQNEVKDGWFVASKAEWAAFEDVAFTKIGVATGGLSFYGLKAKYWSSTQSSSKTVYIAYIGSAHISDEITTYGNYVRLSTTF